MKKVINCRVVQKATINEVYGNEFQIKKPKKTDWRDTMAISAYRENLIQRVMDNSYGNTWEEAVNWEITDCVEDRSRKESCICGKEELKYLYEIHNVVTDKYLYPMLTWKSSEKLLELIKWRQKFSMVRFGYRQSR